MTPSSRPAARPARRHAPPEAASDRSRSPSLPVWAWTCFLLSGAAGLIYEVVWSKQLSYLLGNSLHSISTVVAAFLTGLALGARILGVRLSRRADRPRVYALLEVGIAAWGVISVPLLRGLDPVIGAIYSGAGEQGPLFLLLRFLLLFALMLPPALLMGATLPVLVAHFEYRVGPALARLYAINTAGAVLGSMLAGFLLVPGIGLMKSAMVAALLNGSAGAIAFLAARGAASPAEEDSSVGAASDREKAEATPPLPTPARAAIAVLFAFSGMAALAFQIAWVRLFGLLFGSSVYSFALVLAVYLTGLAIGSAVVAPHTRRRDLLQILALLQLGLALVALGTLHLFPWLPEGFLSLALGARGSWGLFLLGEVGLAAAVLIVPCLLLGAVFPVAARLLQTGDGGHATGLAYAVNTAGTLVGSLLAGFVLIPSIGVQGTHLAAAALSGTIGIAALGIAAARREVDARRLAFGGGGALLAAVLALTAPRWDPRLMSAGVFRPEQATRVAVEAARHPEAGARLHAGVSYERTLFYREGVNGSVYVGADAAGERRWLKVGGKVEASTGGDMATQVLCGMLPGACSPRGASAAVVGLGSGVTVASLVAASGGPVDVIEIEPAVIQASHFFHEPGRDPLADRRVRLILGDARTHLAYSHKTYDIIVSEPSNPWIAGVNNLFTVEFYRLVRARLNRGGAFCQWIQIYELSPRTLASMLASFLHVFPTGHAFFTHNDLFLLAAPPDRTLPLDRVRAPDCDYQIRRAEILGPEALGAFYACPFDSLAPLARGAPFNTDDLPFVEYRAPRDLYDLGRSSQPVDAGVRVPSALPATALAFFAGWPPDVWFDGRVRQLARFGNFDLAMRDARAAAAAGLPDLARRLERDVDRAERRRDVSRLHQAARAAAMRGDLEGAEQQLVQAVTVDSTDGRTWVLLAETRRSLGNPGGAHDAGMRAAALGDSAERSDAEVVLGVLEVTSGRRVQAAAHFRAAQAWRPAAPLPYLFEARARAEAGDKSGALDACRRGLRVAPADQDLKTFVTMLNAPPAAAP